MRLAQIGFAAKDWRIGPVFKLLILLLITGLGNNYLVTTAAARDV